ncbi:MAG: 30S ribosomal protein S12 methylthiotransferase RimO, partial [Pseudomonadota bacterium]
RLEAKIDRTIQVLVDEVDEEGAVARSQGDAPDIDGLVYITDGQELEVGEIASVTVTDCDVHDLYARLADK